MLSGAQLFEIQTFRFIKKIKVTPFKNKYIFEK